MYRDALHLAVFCSTLILGVYYQASNCPAESSTLPEDFKSAVILSYNRIGEDYEPETNLRTDQFESQIKEIISGGYHVISLPELVESLHKEKDLPAHSLVITFDGGYKSILKSAIPHLLKHNLPFTIFFSTTQADSASSTFLSWDDLKKLEQNRLVTIGLHPASYERLSHASNDEILTQMNKTKLAYRMNFQKEPDFFAYPFGEFDAAYYNIIKSQGFIAALGLQSGAAYPDSDLYALPRFSVTEKYGNPEHFKFIINALPLPAYNIEPSFPVLSTSTPLIGFNIDKTLQKDLDRLTCFVSGQTKPQIQILSGERVELRLSAPIENQRTRMNCTIPVQITEENPQTSVARWLGFLFIPPKETASPPTSEPR